MLFGTSPSSSNTMASGSALSRTTDMAGSCVSVAGINEGRQHVFPVIPVRRAARARNDGKARGVPGLDVVKAVERERALRALLLPHQIREPLEQIVRVARTGRSLGVVLHREHRPAIELDAAI